MKKFWKCYLSHELVYDIFVTRQEEGYFRLLISNHLESDDTLFSEFFRLSKDQFKFVEGLLWQDLTKSSTNRTPYPITAHEKLALTLRYNDILLSIPM